MTSLSCRHNAWAGNGVVSIRDLRVEKLAGMRELDLAHVQSLAQKFQNDLNGCEPFVPQNRVACVITRPQIDHILSFNQVTREQFISVNLPRLALPENQSLVCLHGRHRLAAGEIFFNNDSAEWGVDFYFAEGLPSLS